MDDKLSIIESLKILTESIKAWANKNKVNKNVVGELSDLKTSNKTNIVNAINEVSKIQNNGGFVVQSEPPKDVNLLWVDVDDETSEYTNNTGFVAQSDPPDDINLLWIDVDDETDRVDIRELPVVTSDDNGKILMVVDGEWKIVDIHLVVDADGVLHV